MASVTLEAGKFYRTRDGRKVGPMEIWDHTLDGVGALFDSQCSKGSYWQPDGTNCDGDGGSVPGDRGHDLIAECTDAPDLTQITTAFGLLDEPTKARLELSTRLEKFDGTGWVDMPDDYPFDAFVYREKAGSVVEAVVWDRYLEKSGAIYCIGLSGNTPVRVTFNRIDGVIDLASYKVEPRP